MNYWQEQPHHTLQNSPILSDTGTYSYTSTPTRWPTHRAAYQAATPNQKPNEKNVQQIFLCSGF